MRTSAMSCLLLMAILLFSCARSNNPFDVERPFHFGEPGESLGNVDLSTVRITLERQACFGRCPVYTVSVNGQGEVEFNGREYTTHIGEATWTVPPDRVRQLLSAMARYNFTAMPDFDGGELADLSWAVTTLEYEGKTKSVRHYHGDFAGPQELLRLERQIDEVLGTKAYVEKDDQLNK